MPETHWDRDWYLPFELFRRKLIQFMDRLIDLLEADPGFSTFVLDGQTVVLEDYLAIRPYRRPLLEKLVREGRIKIGPWYVLPDEFLVRGESMVRNLKIGIRSALQMGKVMKVGYVPDPFGHISQLPQILRGFGIDTFIFWRGVIDEQTDVEFIWEAPDSSTVLASHQRGRYDNASYLGYPMVWGENERMVFNMQEALEQIAGATIQLSQRSHVNSFLLNNGVDHAEAQQELPKIVECARRQWPKAQIRIAGYDDYMQAIKTELNGYQLHVKHHELVYPFGNLLRGVNSSRMYLKQANARCEEILCHRTEPLLLLADHCKPERTDERDLLDYAWRELLKCHPHDDICGCSVDSVHQEMTDRLRRVEQLGQVMADEALRDIANQMHHERQSGVPFVLYNPAGSGRREALRLRLLFENAEKDLAAGHFRLLDGEGRECPFEVVGKRQRVWHEVRKMFEMREVEVLVQASTIPSCGFLSLYAQPLAKDQRPKPPQRTVRSGPQSLENEFLKVQVAADGSFTLTDKTSGVRYSSLGIFEDQEDCGDEYTWSDLEQPEILTTRDQAAEIELIESRRLGGRLRIRHRLNIPVGLAEDRQRRSRERLELPIETELELLAGSPRLAIRTSVDNRACDHRLRVLFPTPFMTETVQAGGHFDTVKRVIDPTQHVQYVPDFHSPLYPLEHFSGFVRLGDSAAGLAVLAKGLCEYEAVMGESGHTLALTLFRAVGWLSRDDFPRRMYPAGPHLATPEAQMLGRWTFEYALYPHAGDWPQAGLGRQAQQFALAVVNERGDRHGTVVVPGHEQRVQPVPRKGCLPDVLSLVQLEPACLVLTAIKCAEDGREWVVRFYNETDDEVDGKVELAFPAKAIWLANLDETRSGRKPLGRGRILQIPVPGKKIVTLRIRLAKTVNRSGSLDRIQSQNLLLPV